MEKWFDVGITMLAIIGWSTMLKGCVNRLEKQPGWSTFLYSNGFIFGIYFIAMAIVVVGGYLLIINYMLGGY